MVLVQALYALLHWIHLTWLYFHCTVARLRPFALGVHHRILWHHITVHVLHRMHKLVHSSIHADWFLFSSTLACFFHVDVWTNSREFHELVSFDCFGVSCQLGFILGGVVETIRRNTAPSTQRTRARVVVLVLVWFRSCGWMAWTDATQRLLPAERWTNGKTWMNCTISWKLL